MDGLRGISKATVRTHEHIVDQQWLGGGHSPSRRTSASSLALRCWPHFCLGSPKLSIIGILPVSRNGNRKAEKGLQIEFERPSLQQQSSWW